MNVVLRTAAEGEGTPLPLGLTGYPTEADGVPIHYRRAKLARCAEWTHRGSGEPVSITRERVDEWIKNTRALSAAGVKPFIPNYHTPVAKADENNGYIIDVTRDGDDFYAVMALYGDDARKRAAVNGRSIYVVQDARDAKGNIVKGESIAHVALVPNPALPDLGPTVKIAASAGGSAAEVPVLELATTKEPPMFKPETLEKLRSKFQGTAAEKLTDEQLADRIASAVLADPPPDKTPEVTALSADVTRLTGELDATKLALSAAQPKEPDALTMSLTLDAFTTKREQAIACGAISEAGAKAIDTLLMPGGKPNHVALALSGDGVRARPFYARLYEIIAANPGIKAANGVERVAGEPLALSAATKQGDDPAAISDPTERAKAEWKAMPPEQRAQVSSEDNYIRGRRMQLEGRLVARA